MTDTVRPWMREQYLAYQSEREHPPQRMYLSPEAFQAFADVLVTMERAYGTPRPAHDGHLLFKASKVYPDESLSGMTAVRMEP